MRSPTPEMLQTITNPVDQQLTILANHLRAGHFPGYPALDQRLHDQKVINNMAVPIGSWLVNPEAPLPTPDETLRFQMQGIVTDSRGRPLHPWFDTMIQNPDIGVATGRGAYWHWGPNQTVDAIVMNDGQVLLVQRGDTGQWALPGGFVDSGESSVHAALRELAEETSVVLPETSESQLMYTGPVVDIRMTAHAWPETTALLYQIDTKPPAHGQDDAIAAAWIDIEDARSLQLFGSHNFLLDLATK